MLQVYKAKRIKAKWIGFNGFLTVVDDLIVFAEFHGNEELVSSANHVTALLTTIRANVLKQSTLDRFISK